MGNKKDIKHSLRSVTKEDLEQTDLWSHAQLDSEGISEEEFKNTYDDFVLSLRGVDVNFKAMALFVAVQEELENDSRIQETRCNICGKRIDKKEFAEDFVKVYHKEMISTKTEIAMISLKNAYRIATRRIINAILSITGDLVPAVRRYIRTSPALLNENNEFSYYITDDGMVMHSKCYEDQKEEFS